MPFYHFPPEAGRSLGGGAPTAPAIATELQRLGLPLEAVQIARHGETALLEGQVPDDEAREKLVLAVGNLAGISRVEDRLRTTTAAGLLDGLSGFAHLPAGAASIEATRAALHQARPEPNEAFGPAGSLLHQVRPGESLASIAHRHYGTEAESQHLLAANAPMLAEATALRPGIVLRVPPR